MNVELLLKIKQHILEEPRRLYMGDWLLQGKSGEKYYKEITFPDCGTIGCISGWAEVLSGQLSEGNAVGTRGERPLQLTGDQEGSM